MLAGYLRSSGTAEPLWKYSINEYTKRWNFISWRFETIFECGHKLIASEFHMRDSKDIHCRHLSYRLMKSTGELVFQLDSHGQSIPISDPIHLHINPNDDDDRIEDGDWRLDSYSLLDFDFERMWTLVQNYLKDGRVPWRS